MCVFMSLYVRIHSHRHTSTQFKAKPFTGKGNCSHSGPVFELKKLLPLNSLISCGCGSDVKTEGRKGAERKKWEWGEKEREEEGERRGKLGPGAEIARLSMMENFLSIFTLFSFSPPLSLSLSLPLLT